MRFQHSAPVRSAHPTLVAAALTADGLTPHVDVREPVAHLLATARDRLAGGPEGGLPEIRAWRRAFAATGLAPTRYRCAAESLLRRLRRDGDLPRLHPLVDLCNALSAAYAIPVAALDLDRVAGDLVVRPATGDEEYVTFTGDVERPEPGEVVFADTAGRAHSRRWTHRQSGWSAVRDSTSRVLVVAEALHPRADTDVPALHDALTGTLAEVWQVDARGAVLTADAPVFTVSG
ncbi:B3/B4 domain-containing protein [Micromonospora coxensis]|uniref:Phosphoenolpyruvate synthase n=1 Tax=Micromonospora coxensis TaxID=356852 RepID=A0A1C5GRU0_9ACTN|nr:phenylalanine--tRNA ligase beta subunit-related protein [Micromonospora coxensis]SCG36484.1 phosphoenolpyruvate synthase [Micromonospora coxensis]